MAPIAQGEVDERRHAVLNVCQRIETACLSAGTRSKTLHCERKKGTAHFSP